MVLFGGMAFFFNKKINELNEKIKELETRVSETSPNRDNTENINFQKQTSHHITTLYAAIRELSHSISSISSHTGEVNMERNINANTMRHRKINKNSESLSTPHSTPHSILKSIPEDKIDTNTTITPTDEELDRELENEYRELQNSSQDSKTEIIDIKREDIEDIERVDVLEQLEPISSIPKKKSSKKKN